MTSQLLKPNEQSQTTPKSEWRKWGQASRPALFGLLLAASFQTLVAQVRYIPSQSMAPTLQVGDRLVVEKLSYYARQPQRGDIVVFNATPELKSQGLDGDYIKRVVGLPGEMVEVKSGQVWINGKGVKENYRHDTPSYSYGPAIVPVGQYFVLGDNRNRSYDSHLWGFVPERSIVGRAVFRFSPLPHFGFLK